MQREKAERCSYVNSEDGFLFETYMTSVSLHVRPGIEANGVVIELGFGTCDAVCKYCI